MPSAAAPPLPAFAGLEVQGTRVDGTLLVIEARLSVNLNALTIEQAPFLLPTLSPRDRM